MRLVVQRVKGAYVAVGAEVLSRIGRGLCVYAGFGAEDEAADVRYMAEKTVGLRVFCDEGGKMNLSLLDVGGELLIIPNFTLYGDCRRGKRPDFTMSAPPSRARELYEAFLSECALLGAPVKCGMFGADMLVCSENDGPVNIVMDSAMRKQRRG